METAAENPYGDIITSSDSDIEKHNRLFLLKKAHKNWLDKGPAEETNLEKCPDKKATKEKTVENHEPCALCFKNRKLKLQHGVRACSSCGIVLSYAKNNPAALLSAMEKLGTLPPQAELCEISSPDPREGIISVEEFKRENQIPEETKPPAAGSIFPPDLVARVERLEEIGDKIMVIEAARKILFGSPA